MWGTVPLIMGQCHFCLMGPNGTLSQHYWAVIVGATLLPLLSMISRSYDGKENTW